METRLFKCLLALSLYLATSSHTVTRHVVEPHTSHVTVEQPITELNSSFTKCVHELLNKTSLSKQTDFQTNPISLDSPQMQKSVIECLHHFTGQTSVSDGTSPSRRKRSIFDLGRAIFPGTKWCGRDDVAKDYNDLGPFRHTDLCCRAHDQCDVYILPYTRRYGVKNPHPYNICSCKYDYEFRACLQSVDSPTSRLIGHLFFDVLRIPCVTLDYPEQSSGHTGQSSGHTGQLPGYLGTLQQQQLGHAGISPQQQSGLGSGIPGTLQQQQSGLQSGLQSGHAGVFQQQRPGIDSTTQRSPVGRLVKSRGFRQINHMSQYRKLVSGRIGLVDWVNTYLPVPLPLPRVV